MYSSISALITAEEENFRLPITVGEHYEWSMKDHIETTVAYFNSQFTEDSAEDRPFKNIVRPILNLQFRTEGFDVKDIDLFVEDSENHHKSLLVKKFHDRWVREHSIDSFIDDAVETYVTFGGVLVKFYNSPRPEVIPWQTIAFCDQADLLSSPFAIRHFFTPGQLREKEKFGWGDTKKGADMSVEELIVRAEYARQMVKQGKEDKTPGKNMEVYEIHGVLPDSFLKDDGDANSFSQQFHIVAMYHNDKNGKEYVTLYKGAEDELPFKFLARDKIFGRALGFGGGEELFEAQVWTNYAQIIKKNLLDGASKVLYQTTDAAFANRNKTTDLETGEILVVDEGKQITQINTTPVNITLFDKYVDEWWVYGQVVGAAQEALRGDQPLSGTPFKSVEFQAAQSLGLHEYRRGKLAVFVEEIYREWILPYLAKEISKGQKFLTELTIDQMEMVADRLVNNEYRKQVVNLILDGQLPPTDEEREVFKQRVREDFMRGGSKRFMEIFKNELHDAPLTVKVNIAGKQKNLASVVDKLTNVFRQIFATPAILQDPRMMKVFNKIIEYSGLDPIDFSSVGSSAPQVAIQTPEQQGISRALPTNQFTPA